MADTFVSSEIIRIVQVSDTHVSRKRAYFADNWDVFVDEMRRDPPDLIVHSGDVSFDGAADDDIAFARSRRNGWPDHGWPSPAITISTSRLWPSGCSNPSTQNAYPAGSATMGRADGAGI
jgi:3',5'-cyclic AMP phosphodiesterase CpdA